MRFLKLKSKVFILILSLLIFKSCSRIEDLPEEINLHWEFSELGKDLSQHKEFITIEKINDLNKLVSIKQGYIALRAKFDKPTNLSEENLSIYLGIINPTDETFLNGVKIGKTGMTTKTDQFFFSAWNEIRNYPFDKSILKEKENELLIQVYFEDEISLSGNFRIGSKEKLDKLKLRTDFFRSTIYLPISFLLMVMGAFYLLVYFKRKQDKEFLYYAIISISSSMSQLNFFILKLPIECKILLDYFYFQKIVFASVCIFIWALIQYINRILRREIKSWEQSIFAVFTLFPAFLFLISIDNFMLSKIRTPLFIISSLFGLIYIISLVIYKAYIKNKNARLFLVGLIPFAFCILFDLYIHNLKRYDDLIYLGFLGLPSFIVAIGIVQANDFVNYRIQLEELNKSLERRVLKRTERLQIAKDETEKALVEMKRIARTDALTNLFNRLHLMNSLENEWERAKRYKLQLSVLLVDIDHFKKINDTYGHLCGDEVLRNVGSLIAKTFRSIDICGRFGGEEFCIILPNTKQDDGFIAAEKLRRVISEKPILFEGKKINISCSIGISEFKEKDNSIAQLIERADTALYAAKRNGRNQTVVNSL